LLPRYSFENVSMALNGHISMAIGRISAAPWTPNPVNASNDS